MNNPIFVIDVEADGPVAPLYSMVSVGLVHIRPDSTLETFYAELRPLEGAKFLPDALAACRMTRDQTLTFPPAEEGMKALEEWVNRIADGRRASLFSDNPQFDGGYMNYYGHAFLGKNPFGHSCRDIGALYKGMVKDIRKNFKHLRKTRHTHHAVDDAKGNAEALLEMRKRGFWLPL